MEFQKKADTAEHASADASTGENTRPIHSAYVPASMQATRGAR
jgi:hypothetical protein